jgi:hypothetical protein
VSYCSTVTPRRDCALSIGEPFPFLRAHLSLHDKTEVRKGKRFRNDLRPAISRGQYPTPNTPSTGSSLYARLSHQYCRPWTNDSVSIYIFKRESNRSCVGVGIDLTCLQCPNRHRPPRRLVQAQDFLVRGERSRQSSVYKQEKGSEADSYPSVVYTLHRTLCTHTWDTAPPVPPIETQPLSIHTHTHNMARFLQPPSTAWCALMRRNLIYRKRNWLSSVRENQKNSSRSRSCVRIGWPVSVLPGSISSVHRCVECQRRNAKSAKTVHLKPLFCFSCVFLAPANANWACSLSFAGC